MVEEGVRYRVGSRVRISDEGLEVVLGDVGVRVGDRPWVEVNTGR